MARIEQGALNITYKNRTETLVFRNERSAIACRIDDFVNSILEDRKPQVSGEEGRIALSVSLAALDSIETGKTVQLQRASQKSQ